MELTPQGEVFMKKLLGVITGFAVTVAAIAAISAAADPVQATSCVNGTKYTDFNGSRSGNTLTVSPKKKLCKDAKVNFTTFKVLNKNYNGKPFKNNPTALPQASMWNKTVTLKKGSTSKVSVAMQTPDACTPYQIDAYVGPVQTKVTTSKGLVNTTAIVAKLFDKTKSDCTVKVCDPATGKIITVHEKDKNKYKPVGDIACKPPVEVCDPASGEIIEVKAADASKYKPVGDEACEPVEVCDPETGEIIEVTKAEEGNYKPIDDVACNPEPEKVHVCDPATGETITVDESEADNYKPVGDDACKSVKVCDPETGEIIDVKKTEADNYEPTDSDACVEETPEAPEELPTTGPAEALSALFGIGAVAGTTTSYVRSRRALRK